MKVLRRILLLILFVAGPPLLAMAVYLATEYGLAATHRFLDEKTLRYAFFVELALFYLAAFMEVRSRWSTPLK